MAGPLEGRVAIVTGGGGGLAEGICARLASNGAAIAAVDAIDNAARHKANRHQRRCMPSPPPRGGDTVRQLRGQAHLLAAWHPVPRLSPRIAGLIVIAGFALAIHSAPSFDPNWFIGRLTDDRYNSLRNDPNRPL